MALTYAQLVVWIAGFNILHVRSQERNNLIKFHFLLLMDKPIFIPSWIFNCTELNAKKLWIDLDPSPDIYVQGFFEEVKDNYVFIKIYPRGPTIALDPAKLYQQNFQKLKQLDDTFEDMVDMSILNEPEILFNLKVRYASQKIYTRIGPTLIIINPYEEISLLEPSYKEQLIRELRNSILLSCDTSKMSIGEFLSRFKAHIFSFAALTYKQMIQQNKNQAIVITGESGSGKTENTKLAMKMLTSLSIDENVAKSNNKRNTIRLTSLMEGLQKFSIEDQIVSCNPILEAFGNAKTIKNDNSSRFGKFIKIFFLSQDAKIQGAQFVNYLLEKSRVTSSAVGERNFHVFYQLIKGANPQELFQYGLGNETCQDRTSLIQSFKYLAASATTDIPQNDDLSNFKELQRAFQRMQFNDSTINQIFQVIFAILWLGNIDFDETTMTDSTPCAIKAAEPFNKVCGLLQCNLQEILQYRSRTISKQVINTPMKVEECRASRDGLAKLLYDRIFCFLVEWINSKLNPHQADFKSIGLLDIFGFENFESNSFEQLCINFTNEKLQQLYIYQVFKGEERIYQEEGMENLFESIVFDDNNELIDLFEKSPNGLFYLLDDICSLGSSNDEQFLQKLFSCHKGNPYLKQKKISRASFIIVHTASEVEYNSIGFRTKNKDEVSAQIIEVLQHSKMELIERVTRDLIQQVKVKSLGAKFRSQLNDLMRDLFQCDVHFIRCIKPNENKQKASFNSKYVVSQIRYLGLFDSIKMKKEGHQYKISYDDVINNYCEISSVLRQYGLNKLKLDQSDQLIQKLRKHIFEPYFNSKIFTSEQIGCDYCFGKSRLFLKDKAFDQLELLLKSHRMNQMQKALKIVQPSAFKKWRQRVQLKKKLKVLSNLMFIMAKFQIFVRAFLKRKRKNRFQEVMEKIIKISLKYQQKQFFLTMRTTMIFIVFSKIVGKNIRRLKMFRGIKQWKNNAIEYSKYLLKKQKEIQVQQMQESKRLYEASVELSKEKEQVEKQKIEQIEKEKQLQELEQSLREKEKQLSQNQQTSTESENIIIRQTETIFSKEEEKLIEVVEPDEPENEQVEAQLVEQQEEDKIFGPSMIEMLSEISCFQIKNQNVKKMKNKNFLTIPFSDDNTTDLNSSNQIFMNKMLNRDYESLFSSLITNKSKLGKSIPFSNDFRHSSKVLTSSLLNLKIQPYVHLIRRKDSSIEIKEIRRGTLTELLQRQVEIKCPKVITEKQIAALQQINESNAIYLNKLILKYAGEYKTAQSTVAISNRILEILFNENIDPEKDENCTLITPWQFYLIEEIYMQIVKQTISLKEDRVLRYYKLLSMLAACLPCGKRLLYGLLNYLYHTQQSTSTPRDIVKYCRFIFCRLVRENLSYTDPDLYQMISGEKANYSNEIYMIRKFIPTEFELSLISNLKKNIINLYLLNGSFIEIAIESYNTVSDLIKMAIKLLGLAKPEEFTILEFVITDHLQERFASDNERVMDIVTSWHYTEEQIKEGKMKMPQLFEFEQLVLSPFKLFLVYKYLFPCNENNAAQVSMHFLQLYAQVMQNKIPLREDDFINLITLKLCSEKMRVELRELEDLPLYMFIPLKTMSQQTPMPREQILKMISERYILLQKNDCQISKLGYLEYLRQNPLYLSHEFQNILFTERKLNQVVCEVHKFVEQNSCERISDHVNFSQDYLHLFSLASSQKKDLYPQNLEVLLAFKFAIRWGNSKLEVAILDDQQSRLLFEGNMAPLIADILNKYFIK